MSIMLVLCICADRFAAGRSSALVVDIGAGVTTVAPVYDGYVLQKGTCLVESEPRSDKIAVESQALAGDLISENVLAVLQEKLEVDPVPAFRIARKKQVDAGKPAEVTLRKLNHVDPTFEHAAKMVRMAMRNGQSC